MERGGPSDGSCDVWDGEGEGEVRVLVTSLPYGQK